MKILSERINQYTSANLRSRITVIRASVNSDAEGNRIVTYDPDNPDNLRLWASVRALSSVLSFGSAALDNKILYEIVLRYGPIINMDDRIRIDSRTVLRIDAPPVDVENRHQFIALECYQDLSAAIVKKECAGVDLRRLVMHVSVGTVDLQRVVGGGT